MDPIISSITSNKRRTLIFFFLYAVLFAAIGYLGGIYMGEPILGFVIAAIIFCILFLVSYFGGRNVVASMASAREVTKQQEPFLYNTVEGLSIAAGKPMPKVYIIESEVPNAFAAGRNPENAIIAVTNEAVTQTIAAMETEAARPTNTPQPPPTNTPQPTNTPLPTNTPVVQQAEDEVTPTATAADGLSTAESDESTPTPIAALSGGSESAGSDSSSDALPQTGIETWGVLVAAFGLIAVLFAARRLRSG